MPIAYLEQANIVDDDSFQMKVEAGTMIVALSIGTLPPISGVGAQQRQQLASAVVQTPTFAVTQFAWAIVGKPQVNNVDDLSDAQINTVIKQYWDQIAADLFPAGGP